MVLILPFLSFLLVCLPGVVAQTSNAVCLPYYQWTFNSQDRTPCEVASSLLAVCNGGSFNVVALPENQHYQGPTLVSNANPCMCSTVTFSLMSACGLCQGRTILRWSEWSANCPVVSLSAFPESLPSGLRVPAWAYLDVKTNDSFNQFDAKANDNSTESTLIPSSTRSATLVPQVSTTVPSTTKPSSSITSAGSDPTPESTQSVGHANVVGGSIVGSVLGCAVVLGGLVYLMKRYRQRRTAIGEPLPSPIDEERPQMQQHRLSDPNVPSIRVSISTPSLNQSFRNSRA